MKSGFIALDKAKGISSNAAVVRLRRLLPKGTAVGHGGTLDPDATGVLPLCVGKATRLFDYIIDRLKVYDAVLRLGRDTDTQDASGETVRESPVTAGEREIRSVLCRFTGRVMQTPPIYSAIKRDGERLYRIARAGGTVDIEPRPVEIDAIEYLGPCGEGGHRLRVSCHRGVYIRTLCADIAHAVGECGHMESLDRVQAGYFTKDMCLKEEDTVSLAGRGELESALIPMDAPLGYLPRADLAAKWEKAVRNGNPIPARLSGAGWAEGPVRVYLDGEFCGIAQEDEKGMLAFRCMLA